jgi:hypothetical protein
MIHRAILTHSTTTFFLMTITCQQNNLLQPCSLWEVKIPKPVTVLSLFTVFENQLLSSKYPGCECFLERFEIILEIIPSNDEIYIIRFSILKPWVYKFSKNLIATFKFYEPKWWQGRFPRWGPTILDWPMNFILICCSVQCMWTGTYFLYVREKTVKTFL